LYRNPPGLRGKRVGNEGLELGLTPVCGRLEMFEELSLLLAFFHMSNVSRYNPEFLSALRDSRFWPVLLVLKRQGMFDAMQLFWSFMHKKALLLTHGG